jgi:predicted flap endonuclease-1-like 5' DNA nuclease
VATADDLLDADDFVDEEDKTYERPDTETRRILDEDAESADDKDDLKQIKGVGPAIEKTLNELGIFSFNQIAEMSEYEIDRVAQRLKGFRSRIYRQDWIGQARDLHYQKNNNLP